MSTARSFFWARLVHARGGGCAVNLSSRAHAFECRGINRAARVFVTTGTNGSNTKVQTRPALLLITDAQTAKPAPRIT
jgi:hypothetical protein